MDLRTDGVLVDAKPTGPPTALTLTAQSPADALLLQRFDALLRTGAGFAVRLTQLVEWYERFEVPAVRIATDELEGGE